MDKSLTLTFVVFDKPEEVHNKLGFIEIELPTSSKETLICGQQGQYGNDFDANILLEWADETGYNPCYVAAFVQGECNWDIELCNDLGYCGMFQWGATTFSDMKQQPSRYPHVAELDSHLDIIDLDLRGQLDILKEHFNRWGITPEDDLGKMYQSVAFPWCIYNTDDGKTNLDDVGGRSVSEDNPLWRYPEEQDYATCKGISYYAYSKAIADSRLSHCSEFCEQS